MKNLLIISIIALSVLFAGCKTEKKQETEVQSIEQTKPVEKTKSSTIYEVNIRQYTPEGTFNAFASHIPRLKELGVDILWIMPIHPIGEKNRKGTKGSYYAVQDYKAVNPEFGTKEDFRNLVATAHKNGMMLILDWVANHTAWDNVWIESNKDWYTTDSTGNIIAPVADWTDVADLNYENEKMREAMIDALKYWVKEFDIDGYRCDVAGMVPVDFWDHARMELDKIKPVFMLAEAEEPKHHKNAFDANYAWELHHIMNEISKGKMNVDDLRKYFEKEETRFGEDVYRMTFTSNHDENSWNGTVYERMPKSYETFAVFSFVVKGFPLIYSGQEAGLDKRLEFFEKDEIEWKENELSNLYKQLDKLKENNQALWNGTYGGQQKILPTNEPKKIFAFKRVKGDNQVIAAFNFSDEAATVAIKNDKSSEKYTNFFTNENINLSEIKLAPWGYVIGINEQP